MIYLLDTDWIISFLNGKSNAVELISQLSNAGIAITIITWGEVYEGLLLQPDSTQHSQQFQQFTDTVDLVTLDVDAAREYGSIRSQLRSQGMLIPDNDIWIAAMAVANDFTLVSRDKHFERIPNLKLYKPD